MLVYPSGLDLSASALRLLRRELAARRRRIGTRWRRLTCSRQALMALAHLRCGHTFAQLAAGFGVGLATAHRYVTEAVDVLSALAPTLQQAMAVAARKAFVILDGTLLPVDRIAADRPFYSGKHKKHGTSRSSPTRSAGSCGPRQYCRAPSTTSRPSAPTASSRPSPGPGCDAGRTRHIRGPAARSASPTRGRWEKLSAGQKAVNRAHAKIRAVGEQAMATLKSWRRLRKLRCSTTRITDVVRAILALQVNASE